MTLGTRTYGAGTTVQPHCLSCSRTVAFFKPGPPPGIARARAHTHTHRHTSTHARTHASTSPVVVMGSC